MFPIYIMKKGVELPEKGNYYIIASDGIYLHKDTGLIQATVKVERISFLEPVNSSARLMLPKLSQDLIVRSLLFFRAVYKKHRGEAEIQLHYNLATEEYMLHCPKQSVSAAGVSYDSSERFEGFQLVGTIHSHCGFQAFHSSIDQNDEKNFDGLHITIGHVDQPYFTISCSMMVNGKRFTFEPEDVIIGIKKVDWQKTSFLTHRRKAVSHQPSEGKSVINKFFDYSFGDLSSLNLGHYTGSTTYVHKDQFWDMAMPEGQDYRHVGFPKSWMDKVTECVYTKASLIPYLIRGAAAANNSLPEKSDLSQFEDPQEPAGDGAPLGGSWWDHEG